MRVSYEKNFLTDYLYQFLLRCSSEHNPYDFFGKLVEELNVLIPYNQARIIFLDISGKVQRSLLYGVSKKNWDIFMDYYKEDLIGSRYSLKNPIHISESEKISICDWDDPKMREKHELFIADYVQSLRLKYSMGIGFADSENCIRVIISLDRVKSEKFTEDELQLIRQIRPLLENYYINMLLTPPEEFSAIGFLGKQYHLTKREMEIVQLLCSGLASKAIGERLGLSTATVYRHIANIYEKFHISNRQELFALVNRK